MATVEDERVHQLFSEFAIASDALLSKSLERTQSYAEVVNDYRKLEAEFVARMGDSEFGVAETRRRIAESILMVAHDYNPSFEVCREAWNDLVRLGFTNLYVRCTKTWFYADCCAYDEKPEEGLAVVQPLLAELERERDEARAAQRGVRFYEDNIESLGNLRDVLEAQKRGEAIPWRETRRADEAAPQVTPDEEQAAALYDEFSKESLVVFKTYGKSLARSFADVAADYRRVEAEFVARAGEGEAFEQCVLDIRARTAEAILMAACSLRPPFQACRDAWEEFVRIGQDKSWMYPTMYVMACLASNEPEAGLAVVEPWIAEIERQLQEPKQPLQPPGHTRVALERKLEEMHAFRDKLIAKQNGGEPSP